MAGRRSKGVLTRQEIAVLIENNYLIDADEGFVKVASYDLRLGKEVFLCSEDKKINFEEQPTRTCVSIQPFETIIFGTKEKVNLPPNVVGRFDLKIGKALQGLILQVGPQVEPGYFGPLFGSILNTSGVARQIERLEPFLTIEFSYTSKDVDLPEKLDEVKDLDDFLLKRKVDQWATPGIVGELKRDIEECKREFESRMERCKESHKDRTPQIAILLAALAIFLTAYSFFKQNAPVSNTQPQSIQQPVMQPPHDTTPATSSMKPLKTTEQQEEKLDDRDRKRSGLNKQTNNGASGR